jgi:hypothetical protein
MNVSKDTFFKPFNSLTNKWLPNLGLHLSSEIGPRSESRNIKVNAAFDIDYSYSSKEWGGIHTHNCSCLREVTSTSKEIIESSLNGRLKSVCEILYSELSSNSLFSSIHRNTLPIQRFENSCLITCSACNGRGTIICSTCCGSGQVDEWRNEIVGYNEQRDSRGFVINRVPRYESRHYKVNCHSCGGNGYKQCTKCSGDGKNTYVETVNIFAKLSKTNHQWTMFESTLWVNDYLNGNQECFELQYAGDWNLSEQVITDNDNGTFMGTIPGIIIANDCYTTMKSHYATSKGFLKTLGGLVYDCDFIYSEHTYQIASQAIEKNRLEANNVLPLTSSKMFNTCGESNDSGESLPSNELISKRVISRQSSKEMFKLLTLLKDGFIEARNKLSLSSILLRSLFLFVIISLLLMAGAWFYSVEVYKNFSLLNMLSKAEVIFESFTISSNYLNEFTFMAISLFIPSILIMTLFGAKKNWTTKRIIRWYWISAPILAALIMLFTSTPVVPELKNPKILFEALPKLDISVIALLAGIFLARKQSWGKQEKAASLYQSDVLMKKLDYKE